MTEIERLREALEQIAFHPFMEKDGESLCQDESMRRIALGALDGKAQND